MYILPEQKVLQSTHNVYISLQKKGMPEKGEENKKPTPFPYFELIESTKPIMAIE